MKGQGSISTGTIVRIASSLPRRTTTFRVSSFLIAALTSDAVEILWPLMEMMTSCSLSPPLKEQMKRLLRNSNIAITCILEERILFEFHNLKFCWVVSILFDKRLKSFCNSFTLLQDTKQTQKISDEPDYIHSHFKLLTDEND